MARYRKIDPRIWKDENFLRLSSFEKLISIYSFTAQSNRIGFFCFSPGEAAEDLETLPATFAKGFAKVINTLSWKWDLSVRVLYIPTWWKYNCPENPNVLKSCLADIHEVPQTALFTYFSENLLFLPETFHETFRQGLPKPSTKPSPNQEQEQEQESLIRESASREDVVADGFDLFWQAYPNKKEKIEARKVWLKLRPQNGLVEKIIASVEAAKRSPDWQKENGQYIPNPAKWLRRGCWEDEYKTRSTELRVVL